MASSILTLEKAAVGYPRRRVLDNIELDLKSGSFTGLLGPNGCGKSTLLKSILGVIPPLGGRITLHPIQGRIPTLGYVPQREVLDPIYLVSSFEVVLMGVCGRVSCGRRIGRDERNWANECLSQTGALDLAPKLFSELSGGQKQRVLMARALATKPDLLLLDEPIAGIDAGATQAIMDLLRGLHQKHGQTILIVSHDLGTIRQYADDVIWVHQGKVLHGPVQRLLSRDKIEEVMDLEMR